MVDNNIGAHAFCHFRAYRIGFDRDDKSRASEPGSRRCAQANGPLRERMAHLGVELHVPERALCTDNAAMIGSAARWVTPLREFADLDAYASGERGLP